MPTKESDPKSFYFLRFTLSKCVFLPLVNYGVVTLCVIGLLIVCEFLGLSKLRRATLTGTLLLSATKFLLLVLRDSV